jgi:hypothetical protein
MPYYRFVARTEDFHTEDDLGLMELRQDPEAVSFAGGMIHDLMHTHPEVYANWTSRCRRG